MHLSEGLTESGLEGTPNGSLNGVQEGMGASGLNNCGRDAA